MSGANNNFSNKGLDPKFAVPNQKDINSRFGGMTPRSVTATMQGFSNTVMVPRADGPQPSNATVSSVNSVKVVRGPPKTAPERSIFGNTNGNAGESGEKYVDRAMQRRMAEKRQTGTGGMEDETSHFPELIKTLEPSPELFKSGQMHYLYNLKRGNSNPDVEAAFRPSAVMAKPTGPVKSESLTVLSALSAAVQRKVDQAKPTVNLSEDIFPNAGEYDFETAASTSSKPNSNIRAPSVDRIRSIVKNNSPESANSIEAVEVLIKESEGKTSLAISKSSPVDDYNECYPGTQPADSDDDDVKIVEKDDGKKLTKRQKALKERQKIDRDLAKVSKIMKETKK